MWNRGISPFRERVAPLVNSDDVFAAHKNLLGKNESISAVALKSSGSTRLRMYLVRFFQTGLDFWSAAFTGFFLRRVGLDRQPHTPALYHHHFGAAVGPDPVCRALYDCRRLYRSGAGGAVSASGG